MKTKYNPVSHLRRMPDDPVKSSLRLYRGHVVIANPVDIENLIINNKHNDKVA